MDYAGTQDDPTDHDDNDDGVRDDSTKSEECNPAGIGGDVKGVSLGGPGSDKGSSKGSGTGASSSNVATSRRAAVRQAWKREYKNVNNGGTGITRTWTKTQREELLATGKVKGFAGHHIYNVADHPSKARDPYNIQFLTREEHLKAHRGNWQNETHEFYYCGQFSPSKTE